MTSRFFRMFEKAHPKEVVFKLRPQGPKKQKTKKPTLLLQDAKEEHSKALPEDCTPHSC